MVDPRPCHSWSALSPCSNFVPQGRNLTTNLDRLVHDTGSSTIKRTRLALVLLVSALVCVDPFSQLVSRILSIGAVAAA